MLVLDEIQRASVKAMDDLLPTTNAAANPLVLCMGTPPRPTDDGEVFHLLRQGAISGESDDVLYVELGAQERFDLADEDRFWTELRRVNPAFPHRVGERAILRNKKGLTVDSVYRETFGLWDEITKQFSPINGPLWVEAVDIGPADGVKPDALAVDMSHQREISVGAAWMVGDAAHIEEVWAGVDEAAAVEWIVQRAGRRLLVVIDSMSPAASMIPTLKARGVKVHAGTSGDMSKACGLVVAHLEGGRLTHADQEALNDAREGARKRAIGTAGGWGYDRKSPTSKIHPLVAATLALLGASMKKATSPAGSARAGRASSTR